MNIIELISSEGFEEAFWKTLRELRSQDPSATRREAFDRLNEAYRDVVGHPRYQSYDSFRVMRDRRKK